MEDRQRRRRLEEWDDRFLWHPFTPHSVYRDEEPLLIERGEGHYLIDIDGRRYLDGVSSIWCAALGHRRPEIDAALREQLDRIAHATLLGNANVPSIELARRLIEVAPPGLTRVFFSDNGSTAVEVALKIAYQFWQQHRGGEQTQRTRFIAFGNAYHGDTIGSVSVGGVDLFHDRFRGLLFDSFRAPPPYCYRCPLGLEPETCSIDCASTVEALLTEHGSEIAAVIVEPGFQGAAGIVTQPPGWLSRIADATRAAGALLIFDEVAVGMGRSGRLFASRRESISPDLLCVAKGLTGGYLPLAATLATETLYEAFLGPPEEGRTFFHGHTFTGNPLGAAAALATLEILGRPGFQTELAHRLRYFEDRVQMLATHPQVGEVRTYGLAAGIELVQDWSGREPFPAPERRGVRVCRHARDHGVFLRPLGDVVVLMPPLTIEPAEIDLLVDAVSHGLDAEFGSD